MPFVVTAMGPVSVPPSLTLRYTLGNVSVNQALHMPVANHRFVVPEAGIAKELFFGQWKAIGWVVHNLRARVCRRASVCVRMCACMHASAVHFAATNYDDCHSDCDHTVVLCIFLLWEEKGSGMVKCASFRKWQY